MASSRVLGAPDTPTALSTTEEKEKGPRITVLSVDSDKEQGTRSQGHTAPSWTDWVDQWWVWELAAWVIATTSFAAIVILLSVWNNQSVPNWVIKSPALGGKQLSTTLTINSIISLLATILKSTIMIPVAASIAQLKWLWFYGDAGNKLSDLYIFDAANKGPLGSVWLIWRMRGRQVVCIGAIVVVLMLGIDFSFQSVVVYPLRSVGIAPALVPVASVYDAFENTTLYGRGTFPRYTETPTRQMSSIMRSIYSEIDNAIPVTPMCGTGNCTWSHAYASLGICSECQDASDALRVSCGPLSDLDSSDPYPRTACNYTWPAGYGDGSSDYTIADQGKVREDPSKDQVPLRVNFTLINSSSGNVKFNNSAYPLAVVTALYPDWNEYSHLRSVRVAQCALTPCVRKYRARVVSNAFSEEHIETFQNNTFSNSDWLTSYVASGYTVRPNDVYTMIPPASFFEGTATTQPRMFRLSESAAAGIEWDLSRLSGEITFDPLSHSFGSSDGVAFTLFELKFDGISGFMARLAGNMTNAIRMHGFNSTVSGYEGAEGTANVLRPFVSVRWPWLILPILELVLVLLFLLMTMAESSRYKGMLWKGSSLAPFYYPLTKEGRSAVKVLASPRQMESAGDSMTVRWAKTDRGMRLVQA